MSDDNPRCPKCEHRLSWCICRAAPAAAAPAGGPARPYKHMCGARGFDPMKGDICPGCSPEEAEQHAPYLCQPSAVAGRPTPTEEQARQNVLYYTTGRHRYGGTMPEDFRPEAGAVAALDAYRAAVAAHHRAEGEAWRARVGAFMRANESLGQQLERAEAALREIATGRHSKRALEIARRALSGARPGETT